MVQIRSSTKLGMGSLNLAKKPGRRRSIKERVPKQARRSINKDIPLDVLFDILSRLPVNSLSRFKCVSRSWRDLIQDPTFIHIHMHQSPKNNKILISQDKYPTRLYSVNQGSATCLDMEISSYYLASCHGLVSYVSFYRDEVRVCNPATGETISLPIPTLTLSLTKCSLPIIGFGFDSSRKKYKVVGWDARYVDSKIEIFTLGTKSKSWRQIQRPQILNKMVYFQSYPVYVNDASDWYTNNKELVAIISFSFVEEKFTALQVPDCIRESDSEGLGHTLHNLSGQLCLLRKHVHEAVVRIWVLTENYQKQEWICQRINLPSTGVSRSIWDIRDGELLIFEKYMQGSGECLCLGSYNEQSQVTDSIRVAGLAYDDGDYLYHAESLLSLQSVRSAHY